MRVRCGPATAKKAGDCIHAGSLLTFRQRGGRLYTCGLAVDILGEDKIVLPYICKDFLYFIITCVGFCVFLL